MVSNVSYTPPALNPDGTISAIVQAIQPLPNVGAMLRLWLPVAYQAGGGFGRFFLARCAEDTPDARAGEWSIYARRVLLCAGMPTAMPDQAGSTWAFLLPGNNVTHSDTPHKHMWHLPQGGVNPDPGYRWLLHRTPNTSINLLGPFGQLFELAAHTRTLLVLTDPPLLPTTLPAVHTMLDRGGRVTMFIKGDTEAAAPLLPLIPIPVEVRIIPDDGWLSHLAEPVRWADQLCAALPNRDYAPLAHHIRTLRFQLDNSFAHVLVTSDILCGVGACLACVVPTRDGSYTRSCIHGPVFPLTTLA